jgi:hypothetical protein
MTSEQPAPKISGQTIIYIIMVVLLFLFFMWSSVTTPRNKGYEEIPQTPPNPAEKH